MQAIPLELIVPLLNTAPVPPARPRYFWLFAAWMAVGTAIAAAAGTVLGILAAMEISIGADRWTQSVQAHGRLQLFGFIAPFVVALVLEFVPRLNGTRPITLRTRLLVPGVLALGASMTAIGTISGESGQILAVGGTTLFAAGAIGVAAASWRQRPIVPIRIDPQPLFLHSAAFWLVVAAAFSAWFTVQSEAGVTELAGSQITVEVFLRGFITMTIMGVGLRIFVGHLDLPPVGRGRQQVVLVGANLSILAWIIGQGPGDLSSIQTLSRLGDFGYAFVILLLTHWLQIMRVKERSARREVYEVLIPVAWAALVLYAVAQALIALTGLESLSIYQQGAVRHLFLLGFAVPLMVAVAQIVLARFGTGYVEWQPALTLAFILLVAAWPMRVVPALLSDSPGAIAQALLGVAGILTICSLALVSAACAKTAHACRQSEQLRFSATQRQVVFVRNRE